MTELLNGVVQPLVISLIGILVSMALGALFNFIQKKTGIEVSESIKRRAQASAIAAVMAAEEVGFRKLEGKALAFDGEYKHNWALNALREAVPELTQKQADTMVGWAVAQVPGVGKTNNPPAIPS